LTNLFREDSIEFIHISSVLAEVTSPKTVAIHCGDDAPKGLS
jgi:hypothetical protein